MKKRLNIEGVSNELRGGSAFFPSYEQPASPTEETSSLPSQPAIVPQRQPESDVSVRPNVRTPVRSNGRRIITRNSFEVYEDQMDSLRKIAFEEKMNGGIGSMSAMVREAIDKLLEARISSDK